MFQAKTQRIAKLVERFPGVTEEFERLFTGSAIYIDYGNVRNWSDKLGWHIDLKRLKQLLDSFIPAPATKLYYGTLAGNADSLKLITDADLWGYQITTKRVKSIRLSIDVSSISGSSPDIIRNFISERLLATFSLKLVEQLNDHLRDLNRKGIMWFEDLKCNFDVEIGRDLLMDGETEPFTTFMLWSCDSDFAGPVSHLLRLGKNVIVCGIGGMVARELNQLRSEGLRIYDVRKLKEFICWPRELSEELKGL